MSEWAYVTRDTRIGTLRDECEHSQQNMFVVVNSDDTYQGFIRVTDIDACPNAGTAGEVLDYARKFDDRNIFVYVNTPVDKAKEKMKQNKLQFIPVLDFTGHYQGTLDRSSAE